MKNIKKIEKLLPLLSQSELEFLNKINKNQTLQSMSAKEIKSTLGLVERTIQAHARYKEDIEKLLSENEAKRPEFMATFPEPYILDSVLLKEMKAFLAYEAPLYTVELPFTYGLAKTPKELQLDVKKFTTKKQAVSYFKDEGRELFECGQGIYQDYSEEYCYIEDVFFKAKIKAEIFSSKQDVGDRLYWVERIESVDFLLSQEAVMEDENRRALQEELNNARLKVEELERRLGL